jgi:hypothetical protein
MAVAATGFGVGFLALGLYQHAISASSFGAVSLLVAFFCLIKQQTSIDTDSRMVSREGYLFGRYRLWRRRRPLNDFVAVRCRRYPHPGENDTVFIGLRRRAGRVMELRYCNVTHGSPGSQAQSDARWLADITGLPLDENVA